MGVLRVVGPERTSWLNGLVTCDVNQVKPGVGQWGLSLDRKGKIQSVIWVLDAGGSLLLATSPTTTDTVISEFDRMLIMEDAELQDVSEEFEWIVSVQPLPTSDAEVVAELRLGTLAVNVAAMARSKTPEWVGDAQLMTEKQWLALRLLHALPEYGVDFGAKDRPHEAGLERSAVSWSKGCYLGQEVVCMQDMRGKVSRHVTALEVQAPPEMDLAPGVEVLDSEGQAIGTVSSVSWVSSVGGWLALAMLPVAAQGGPLMVKAGGRRWPASIFQPRASES